MIGIPQSLREGSYSGCRIFKAINQALVLNDHPSLIWSPLGLRLSIITQDAHLEGNLLSDYSLSNLKFGKGYLHLVEEKLASICSETVVQEDLMKIASSDYSGDQKFVELQEKYVQVFRDPISFDVDVNSVDGGNDSDGDDDNDDGNGNNDEEFNDDNDEGNGNNDEELNVDNWYVTDIAQKEKNKAKWTKPSTGLERGQKYRSQRRTRLLRTNPGPLNGPGTWDKIQRSRSISWRTNMIEGLGLEMGGASKRLEGSSYYYIRRASLT
ncbi:hypothetical protein Tco_0046277 [Tanacetum coccineum]